MSPERMQGPLHNVIADFDFKSDIWSLGCVLYEMCALQSPFYSEQLDKYTICQNIERCIYPPLMEGVYSVELCQLIIQCLHLDPTQRPDITQVQQVAHLKHAQCCVVAAAVVTAIEVEVPSI